MVDGNERLGWLRTAVFLRLNGVPAERADDDAVHRPVMSVAEGDAAVAPMATALRRAIEGSQRSEP